MPTTPSRARLPRLLALLLLMVTGFAGTSLVATPAQASTTSPSATAIRYGLAQLGDAYVYGATGPTTFDCSGLTSAAYRYAGISLPRTSRDQYDAGTRIARSSWAPRDLVFWATDTRSASTIHHVAIYLGDNTVLHAPHTGDVVRISTLWSTGLMPYAVRPSASSSAMFASSLVYGASGDAVRDVQTRLRANGYGVSATGVFDSPTLAAAKSFQVRIGLGGSGTVGPVTWGQLITHGTTTRVS